MTERATSRLAWSLWILGIVAFAGTLALRSSGGGLTETSNLTQIPAFFAIGTVGLVIARHRPENPLGWLYLGVWASAMVLFGFVGQYAYRATVAHPGEIGGTFAVWLGNWTWVPVFAPLVTLPFLLFPTGRVPSPRWRPVLWAVIATTIAWSMAFAFEGHDFTDALNRPAPNPYTPHGLVPFFNIEREVLGFAFIVLAGLCVAALIVRYRGGDRDERAQIKWLILAGAATVIFLAWPVEHGNGGIVDVLLGVVLALIPLATGIAILKYRLYDIDVVLSKTIVYGALAVFITLVYVAVVVGLGTLVSAQNGNLFLSIVATAVVAIAFQPVRLRVQRVANRFVYGERATPYEILARFSERVAATYATEDVLPRTARVIAEGTGAERVAIWLRLGSDLRLSATWPAEDGSGQTLPLLGEELPEFEGVDRAVAVRYRDEVLGVVTLSKPRAEPLTPAESALLDDVVQQAGLVLSNVRLTADLEGRLEQISQQADELRASRQRIVAAQDEERRRLERNIHDGAQQHLVALAVKLRLAKGFLGKDLLRARAVLGELRDEVGEALDTLTALSAGIYPPLLEEQGLAAALAAQYQRSELPVHMTIDGTRRYPIETEAAVYFCVLEALQNAAKYAGASSIEVHIGEQDGGLGFETRDDGRGFDTGRARGTGLQNMADRLSVLGGSVEVVSASGAGTTVRGRVPLLKPEGVR